jgi:hypothetical protein
MKHSMLGVEDERCRACAVCGRILMLLQPAQLVLAQLLHLIFNGDPHSTHHAHKSSVVRVVWVQI